MKLKQCFSILLSLSSLTVNCLYGIGQEQLLAMLQNPNPSVEEVEELSAGSKACELIDDFHVIIAASELQKRMYTLPFPKEVKSRTKISLLKVFDTIEEKFLSSLTPLAANRCLELAIGVLQSENFSNFHLVRSVEAILSHAELTTEQSNIILSRIINLIDKDKIATDPRYSVLLFNSITYSHKVEDFLRMAVFDVRLLKKLDVRQLLTFLTKRVNRSLSFYAIYNEVENPELYVLLTQNGDTFTSQDIAELRKTKGMEYTFFFCVSKMLSPENQLSLGIAYLPHKLINLCGVSTCGFGIEKMCNELEGGQGNVSLQDLKKILKGKCNTENIEEFPTKNHIECCGFDSLVRLWKREERISLVHLPRHTVLMAWKKVRIAGQEVRLIVFANRGGGCRETPGIHYFLLNESNEEQFRHALFQFAWKPSYEAYNALPNAGLKFCWYRKQIPQKLGDCFDIAVRNALFLSILFSSGLESHLSNEAFGAYEQECMKKAKHLNFERRLFWIQVVEDFLQRLVGTKNCCELRLLEQLCQHAKLHTLVYGCKWAPECAQPFSLQKIFHRFYLLGEEALEDFRKDLISRNVTIELFQSLTNNVMFSCPLEEKKYFEVIDCWQQKLALSPNAWLSPEFWNTVD